MALRARTGKNVDNVLRYVIVSESFGNKVDEVRS